MAAGDLVQVGSTVAVGFNSLVYGTMLMEVASYEPFANEKRVPDERDATYSIIYTDPGTKLTLTGTLLAADLAAFEALDLGSVITINSLSYRVVSAVVSYSPTETKGTIECRSEDSLTATGGPLTTTTTTGA